MKTEKTYQEERFNTLCVLSPIKAVRKDKEAFTRFMSRETYLTKRELNSLIKILEL